MYRLLRLVNVVFVVEHHLDFGNHFFRVGVTTAEGIVLVGVEIEQYLVASLEVVVKDGPRIPLGVVGDDDAQSLVAVRVT